LNNLFLVSLGLSFHELNLKSNFVYLSSFFIKVF
jgi:hypothetical protein